MQRVAKQVVTLDHLSDGRATLGVGLGFPEHDELGAFGEATGLRERAARTDEALTIIDLAVQGRPIDHTGPHYDVHAYLHPRAIQAPRPPIWIAATPPHRAPLVRAARWDGVVCNVKVDGDLLPLRPAELADYLGGLLVDTAWPGPGWLERFRQVLGLT